MVSYPSYSLKLLSFVSSNNLELNMAFTFFSTLTMGRVMVLTLMISLSWRLLKLLQAAQPLWPTLGLTLGIVPSLVGEGPVVSVSMVLHVWRGMALW